MDYEKMWGELKRKIENGRKNAWAKGIDVDYETFIFFEEIIRDIENNEAAQKGE